MESIPSKDTIRITAPMKKSKLEGSISIDFDLFGLVTNVKEYKLAWNLNNALDLALAKQDDIRIDFSDQSTILISYFLHQTENKKIELLQNKLVSKGTKRNQYLVPELSQFDFLLKCRDLTGEMTSENVIGLIRNLSVTEYVVKLNFDNLKSKENLLF